MNNANNANMMQPMTEAMNMVIATLNKATNAVAGGAIGSLMPTGVSKFDDSGMSPGVIVLLVVIIMLYIALLIAVYRLTGGSWLHTILCLIFGSLYLMCVVIYFGFSGYRIVKVVKASNN